jgi:alanyl-tRNA synthetase
MHERKTTRPVKNLKQRVVRTAIATNHAHRHFIHHVIRADLGLELVQNVS